MALTTCDLCKNAFYADANQSICLACEELRFEDVKAYIESHEDVSFIDLIEETGVSKKNIDKWLMEGRLIAKGNELQAYVATRRKAIEKLAKAYPEREDDTKVASQHPNQLSFHTKK